jgi:hypothetical protein
VVSPVAIAQVQALREKLGQTQGLMAAMNRSWEEKLREAEKMRQENAKQMEASGVSQNVHKVRMVDELLGFAVRLCNCLA